MSSILMIFLLMSFPAFSIAENVDDSLFEGTTKIDKQQQLQTASPSLEQDPHDYYRHKIESVLRGEDFGATEKKTIWRLKEKFKDKDEEKVPDWIIGLIEFLEVLLEKFDGTSKLIEVILWVIFTIFIVFLIIKYRHVITAFVREFRSSTSNEAALPVEMFGLDIRCENLPKDLVASAEQLWQKMQQRQAVALLLRATLSRLLNEQNCKFSAGDTEYDCLQKVAALQDESLTHFMKLLTDTWQQLAYAHQMPSDEGFILICQQWQEVFDAR